MAKAQRQVSYCERKAPASVSIRRYRRSASEERHCQLDFFQESGGAAERSFGWIMSIMYSQSMCAVSLRSTIVGGTYRERGCNKLRVTTWAQGPSILSDAITLAVTFVPPKSLCHS